MSAGELILYRSEDGGARVQLRAVDGTVWLTQAEIAELFQITPQTVTRHIQSVYAEGELDPGATCTQSVQVRSESRGDSEGSGVDDVQAVKDCLTTAADGNEHRTRHRHSPARYPAHRHSGAIAGSAGNGTRNLPLWRARTTGLLLVIPAQAGIHGVVATIKMDSGLRRNDGTLRLSEPLLGTRSTQQIPGSARARRGQPRNDVNSRRFEVLGRDAERVIKAAIRKLERAATSSAKRKGAR